MALPWLLLVGLVHAALLARAAGAGDGAWAEKP
jgi:hypothetical protein